MTPYLTYLKIGAWALAAASLFGAGYHARGIRCKTAADAAHVAQLQAVINQLDENARVAAADHAHLQGVIDRYDAIKDLPDPAAMGTARRVLVVASSAGNCEVSKAAEPTAGTPAPAEIPASAQRLERALDDYVQACSADARQLSALIELVSK